MAAIKVPVRDGIGSRLHLSANTKVRTCHPNAAKQAETIFKGR